MKPFLQPLTADEEALYLHWLKSENEENVQIAKNQLIEHNMRLVAHIVKKYQNAEEDLEEYISIGTLGLLKAVLSYDDTKGSKLGTYAARCIENELLMMFRNKKKKQKEVSLNEPVGVDSDGNELKLMDLLIGENADLAEKLYNHDMLQKSVQYLDCALTPRERQIIRMRYGLGNGSEYTQKEIGEMLHISRSYVSRIEKKALHKLRQLLDSDHYK